MHSMFTDASSFNGDLSRWNASQVTDRHTMFTDASSFNGDLRARLHWFRFPFGELHYPHLNTDGQVAKQVLRCRPLPVWPHRVIAGSRAAAWNVQMWRAPA
jgi:hypothetical protein